MTQTHTPLPCPLCGTAPSIHGGPDMGYRIICRHDGSILGECSVSDNTKEAAIEAWNRRAPDASQAAEIARLRNKVPARSLTDSQLRDEIKAVDAVLDAGFGEGSGSPGEWWYERADELEHERKRRELEAQLSAHNARAALEPRS